MYAKSNQNYNRLKTKKNVMVNVIALILVITTTLYLLSSVSVLPSIRAEVTILPKLIIFQIQYQKTQLYLCQYWKVLMLIIQNMTLSLVSTA